MTNSSGKELNLVKSIIYQSGGLDKMGRMC